MTPMDQEKLDRLRRAFHEAMREWNDEFDMILTAVRDDVPDATPDDIAQCVFGDIERGIAFMNWLMSERSPIEFENRRQK